jgi:hypothetical protein
MSIQSTTQTLERLLRWEEAAGAAYERACRNVAGSQGDAISLFELRQDHRYAAGALRNLLLRLHAAGELRGEASAKWAARTAEEVATLFGRAATLTTLEQGEKVLQSRLESALASPKLVPEASELLGKDLLPRCRARVTKLEQALAA